MKNFFLFLIISPIILFGSDFGYISYSSPDVGDDFQAIAAKRFLPKTSIPIDREFISEFYSQIPVHTIINGGFMITKYFAWYLKDVKPPEKSWPPSDSVCPLFISLYLEPQFYIEAFSEESIEYFKTHAPIGARDFQTLKALEDHGIPAYFSGCLTLTLQNTYKGNRQNVIYAVDVSEECLKKLKSSSKAKVIPISHRVPREIFYARDNEKRLRYAKKLLDKYSTAKCVVTSRLHAALPCLALQTPVLLIEDGRDGRLDGLRELVRSCNEEEFLNDRFVFDVETPFENPNNYLMIREKLIEKINAWSKGVRNAL